MSSHFDLTIKALCDEVAAAERDLIGLKRTVNGVCRRAGRDPVYSEGELQEGAASLGTLRSDQFYGKPLATAVREVLQMRQSAGLGAATVGEVYDSLSRGGYAFSTKSDQNAKRGLRVSLSKNPAFHRIASNNTYGLTEWYPAIREARREAGDESAADPDGAAPNDG